MNETRPPHGEGMTAPLAWQPPGQEPSPTPPRKHRKWPYIAGGAAALVAVFAIAGALAGTSPQPAPVTRPNVVPASSYNPAGTSTSAPTPTPAAPQFSASQEQAITAAEGYLSDGQGFSKAGLIAQLDSHYGDGFSARDARFAVDHIKVSWRQQAVISAKGYMSDGQGFSYAGLVQQLDSPYGDQFTYGQAVYAANKVMGG